MATDGNNQLMKSLALSNRGKRFQVMELVKSNTEIAAMMAKLVSPTQPSRFGRRGEREIDTPNTMAFREVAASTARNIEDSRTVLSLLPDIELSAQILVSSIISPKDMMSTELIFMAPEEVLPSTVSQALLTKLRVHFDQVYKIKPLLNGILRDMLVETGSYVAAVLPENSIDDVINRQSMVTMESVQDFINPNGEFKSLGLLGAGVESIRFDDAIQEKTMLQIAQESFNTYSYSTTHKTQVHGIKVDAAGNELRETFALEGVTVTDNLNLLKYPALQERIRTQRVYESINKLTGVRKNLTSARLGIAQEARSPSKTLVGNERKLTDREMTAAAYRQANAGYTPVTVMRTQEQLKRRTIGNPLIMHLPSEAVIPVHVPGQEDKHVGYFVLLDSMGNPLSNKTRTDHYQELAQRMNASSGQSMPSQLLQRVKSMTNGADCSGREHLDYSVKAYGDIIEQDLMARLRNGVYNNGVALARNEEVYRIMLSRTLARQQTQLLFLPIELVTYFAFRYSPDGIGKSLLDDMRVLNSLRAMTMFANVMASIRNSVGMVDVKVKLDEDDGDPKKTIEMVQDEFLRARQQAFPLGVNSPVDITKWLQRAGISFSWESHPGLPDINVDISEKSTNYVKPDEALEEQLRKQSIMGFGLNPETVDTAFNGEFATSVMNNNLLLSRRVLQYQERFEPMLTDHLVKVAMASQYLVEDMRGIINEAWETLKITDDEAREIVGNAQDLRGRMVDHLLSQFMCGLNVGLPKPDTVTIDNQKESYDSFVELLDSALNDAWLNTEFLTGPMMGKVGENAAEIKATVRAHFIREWLSENGVMTQLSALTATDEEGKPKLNIFESQKQHMEGVIRAFGQLMVGTEKARQDSNKVLEERVEPQETTGGFGGGFGGGGGDFGNPGGGGTDDFGMDEFGAPPGGEGNPDQNPEGNPEGNPENPDENQNPEDEEGGNLPRESGSPEASLR